MEPKRTDSANTLVSWLLSDSENAPVPSESTINKEIGVFA